MLGGALPAQAQGFRGPRLEARLDTLTARLDLSAEQQTQVRALLEAEGTKRRALFQQHQDDRPALRAAMRDLRATTDAEIAKVLTEQQQVRYEKLQTEQEARRSNRPRLRRNRGTP